MYMRWGDPADGFRIILLIIDNNQDKETHHGLDNACYTVPDTIYSLRQFGRITQQHENRNKHRPYDYPFCGSTPHKKISKSREDNKEDYQRYQSHIDALQPCGTIDSKQ